VAEERHLILHVSGFHIIIIGFCVLDYAVYWEQLSK